eukprot:753681-Hanusia_phi.AAC.6
MKVFNASNKRSFVPHFVAIFLAVDEGNPDCFITPDFRIQQLGPPRKESCVWHVKTNLKVLPTDPNYSSGKYHVQIAGGVDKCEFRIRVLLDRFIPTITLSQKGAGGGFRPGLKEKMENIWKSVIVGNISSSDQRRKQGWAGNFPMTDLNITSTMLQYAERSAEATQRTERPNDKGDKFRRAESSLSKQSAAQEKSWGDIVSVTFNRAVSSISSSRAETGQIRLKTRPFKVAASGKKKVLTCLQDILYPKSSASPEGLNLSLMSNTLTGGGRQALFTPLAMEPALEEVTSWRASPLERSRLHGSPSRARSTPISSPVHSIRETSAARDEVVALLKGAEPVAKKILPGYKYIELDVPTACVRGYAVKLRDGFGVRKIVQSDSE